MSSSSSAFSARPRIAFARNLDCADERSTFIQPEDDLETIDLLEHEKFKRMQLSPASSTESDSSSGDRPRRAPHHLKRIDAESWAIVRPRFLKLEQDNSSLIKRCVALQAELAQKDKIIAALIQPQAPQTEKVSPTFARGRRGQSTVRR
jgi:hypothetical protein